MTLQRVETVALEAADAIAAAQSAAELEQLRVRFLGRKAELPQLLREVRDLSPADRSAVGKAGNQARQALESLIASRRVALMADELETELAADRIDITLPGTPPHAVGRLHLITQTWREIEDVFLGLGFTIMEGPEVELVAFNFDALNHLPTHPARARTDTFYVADDVVLRTHTSPMQVRAMMEHPPPLFVVIPGRVYRRDSDATHTPQFHQVEGLAIAEDITLADLKGTLLEFTRQIFGAQHNVRLRGHFFPFTEPSVEVDVSCFNCKEGFLRDGSRCTVCRGEAWLEILGAGEVDPNVLSALEDPAYDPERVQGFAWGMGIERIAMLKHGVPDLRVYYENDLRFLEQFG